MSRSIAILISLLAAAMLVAACGDEDESTDDSAGAETTTAVESTVPEAGDEGAQACAEVEAPEPKQVNLKPPKAKAPTASEVTFTTSCGDFTVTLAADQSPKTAASFQYLAEEGVFDQTPFHRVVPGFVVQGGDPKGDGTGGPGYSVDEKPPPSTSYTRGMVAMAKTDAEPPGRSGSQFFVVTAPDAGLPPDFAIAGEVTDGLDVVEAIEALGVPDSDGRPSMPVVVESVTVN